MYNKYVSGVLGQKKLSNIKYSDIRRLYNSLIDEQGFKPNSMEVVHTILHPIFAVAVRDDIINKNPTDGVMSEIKKSHNWDKGIFPQITANTTLDLYILLCYNVVIIGGGGNK